MIVILMVACWLAARWLQVYRRAARARPGVIKARRPGAHGQGFASRGHSAARDQESVVGAVAFDVAKASAIEEAAQVSEVLVDERAIMAWV
jgi:hypothetical protein